MLAWYQNVNITWQAFACACIESLEVESKELETHQNQSEEIIQGMVV